MLLLQTAHVTIALIISLIYTQDSSCYLHAGINLKVNQQNYWLSLPSMMMCHLSIMKKEKMFPQNNSASIVFRVDPV